MSEEVKLTKEQSGWGALTAVQPKPAGHAASPHERFAERVAEWSKLASRAGFTDFVSPEDGFRTCLASSTAWANKDRPGIYFWLATDGEAYIGQSVSPQSRLRQHWRDHRDIEKACFRACPIEDLDRVEEELIDRFGQQFPLRNIKHAVATTREVPFDRLVTDAERERFLAGAMLLDDGFRESELLMRLQARKFEKFAAIEGGRVALAAARAFIDLAIPKPAATEVSFWSITLFPSKCFLRVNAGQQEVFTCGAGPDGEEARILTDKRISLLRSHDAGDRVPSYVTSVRPSRVTAWLSGEALLSCRRLVVRLMRHTTTLNSGSHCPQAVRADLAGG